MPDLRLKVKNAFDLLGTGGFIPPAFRERFSRLTIHYDAIRKPYTVPIAVLFAAVCCEFDSSERLDALRRRG